MSASTTAPLLNIDWVSEGGILGMRSRPVSDSMTLSYHLMHVSNLGLTAHSGHVGHLADSAPTSYSAVARRGDKASASLQGQPAKH